MSTAPYLADLSQPITKPLPAPPTLEEAQAAIKANAKYNDEARSYEAAGRKMYELAKTLRNAARSYPYGIMQTLGYVPGRVMLSTAGRIGVVVSVYDGIAQANIQTINAKNRVSPAYDATVKVDVEKWEQWEWLGHTVERNRKFLPSYDNVLVPAEKRVKAN